MSTRYSPTVTPSSSHFSSAARGTSSRLANLQQQTSPTTPTKVVFTPSPPKVPPPKPPAGSPRSMLSVFKRADVHPRPPAAAAAAADSSSALGPAKLASPEASPIHIPRKRAEYCAGDFSLGVTLGTGSFGRVCFARFSEPQTEEEKVGSAEAAARVAADAPPQSARLAIKVLKKTSVVRMNQVEHTKHEKNILEMIGGASWGDACANSAANGAGQRGRISSPPTAGAARRGPGHPFIVKMLGAFQDAKRLYMVLEFVRGGEFFTHLRHKGHMKNHEAVFYAASVASVFAFLHAGHIAYRDLKPENLLLDHEGYVKVTDFGFAKHVPDDKTYTLCGTPEYIAPEVLLNQGHGRSVDWWALGILTYEMLSGQAPFVSQDPMAIYQQVVSGTVAYPSYFHPDARSFLRRLLERDLTKRFGCLAWGAADVCQHRWFDAVHFEDLLARRVKAPIVPPTASPDDTSQFEQYPEEDAGQDGGLLAEDPFEDGFGCVC
jgi:protein kinase A